MLARRLLARTPAASLRGLNVRSARQWQRCSAPVPASVRHLHATLPARHGDFEWEDPKSPDEIVHVTVVARDGQRYEMKGKVGDNLLYVSHRWRHEHPELALEGACEASLACSTCHVIVR
jgi:hypothetical protein